MVALDAAAQHSAGANQVILADQLIQSVGTQARGEGRVLGAAFLPAVVKEGWLG